MSEAKKIIIEAKRLLLEEGWSPRHRRERNGALTARCALGALWDAACVNDGMPGSAYGEACTRVLEAIGRRTGEEQPSIARFNASRWTTLDDIIEVFDEAERAS